MALNLIEVQKLKAMLKELGRTDEGIDLIYSSLGDPDSLYDALLLQRKQRIQDQRTLNDLAEAQIDAEISDRASR